MLPATAFLLGAVPVVVWCVWRGWSRVSRLQLALRCVLVLYAFGVVGVTMCPLPVVPTWIRFERESARTPGYPHVQYNVIPGRCVTDTLRHVEEGPGCGIGYAESLWLLGKPLLGNLVMLLPLGYLLPWISVRWCRWWRTTGIVVGTTLTIESLQLLGSLAYGFPFKRFDVDDLWINTLGGLIGYGLWKLVAPLLRRFERPLGAQAASSQEL